MFQRFPNRPGHYALLTLTAAALFLVNLGGPSLWDIDEGNNAEAAREMMENENWVIPYFNAQLRADKPALLYWLQIAAYHAFGVNEFAARLPSALASLLAVLLTYELGRRLFGAATGLLAGLVLASTLLFCAAAHFANPDALLNAFTVLALLAFWVGFDTGWRGWPVPAGIATGLAMLAKGPVGLVMPGAAALLFLLWQRRLRFLWASRLVLGTLAFVLVAVPWYAWVGAETKTEFLQGFFLKHNVGRYLSPMENHRGPIFYYVAVLMLGFLPWSVFLVPAGWDIFRSWRAGGVSPRREQPPGADAPGLPKNDPLPALRFLCCWIAVYLVFFSLSRTKLPNYVLPVYAPTAVLTARFLHRWRGGLVSPPGWVLKAGLAGLALVGVGLAAGLLLAGGAIEAPFVRRRLPGLEAWAVVGLLPVLGAAAAWRFLRRENRPAFVSCCTATAVLFVGLIGAHGGVTLDRYKAPKPLARLIEHEAGERDVRIAAYGYFQPSLVFYCRREVQRLEGEDQALEFLRYPVPVYLVAPAPAWERLKPKVDGPLRVLGRYRDLYRNCDVVVVANQPADAPTE